MSNPSTPERPLHVFPAIASVRRVHTHPSKLADPTRTPPQIPHSDDAIETLLTLDFAKVVSFEDPSARPGSSRSESSFTSQDHTSLPWTTPTERTLAAGMLTITFSLNFSRTKAKRRHGCDRMLRRISGSRIRDLHMHACCDLHRPTQILAHSFSSTLWLPFIWLQFSWIRHQIRC
jgi:hypothetical protein